MVMRAMKTALFCAAAWASLGQTASAAPQPMSTATAADLIPHAIIRRDTYGVPHITADTDEAAAFAMGFAVAEDHALEMGKLYLIARGEAARWFGPEYLDGDFAQKRMGNLEGARRTLEETGDGYRRWLHGFVTGVNHYAQLHRAALPEWFPTVTEADLIAFSHEGASSSAVRAPRAAGGEGGEGNDGGLTDPAGEIGSNALAISGARSTTGAPILLANPHLRWTAQYWEAQITVPGQINFYGSLTVGLAVLRAGFGDNIGYAQTNNNVDLVDHYAVPRDPGTPGNYVFKGKSTPFKRQTVRVDVLQPTGQVTTEERAYLATDFGPVVSQTAAAVVVSRSADTWRFHEGYYDLYFAKDLASFMAILSRQLIPSSNFTYADGDGNIQYLWNSALPKRPDQSVDYLGVVPGDDDRYFFDGVVPLSEVPRFLNPASGYVMNSNNPPWFATVRERLNPSKFPSYMEQGEPGLRPQQALHMLEAHKGRFSPEDIRKLKYTAHLLITDRVLPDLFAAGARVKSPSADLRNGLRILKAWDRQAAARSKGAVLFQAFWGLYERAAKPAFREPWSNDRVIETPTGLADPAKALAALEQAVALTRDDYGKPDVAWGEVNRYRFGDIDLPGHGGPQGFGQYTAQTFDAPKDPAVKQNLAGRSGAPAGGATPILGGGDGWVLLVNFTKPVRAQGVLAYGQSSDSSSKHSRDQIKLFAANKLRPIWFTEAEVKANLEREYRPGEAKR